MVPMFIFMVVGCSRSPVDLTPEEPIPVAPSVVLPPTAPPPAPSPYIAPDPGETATLFDREFQPAALLAIASSTEHLRLAQFVVYPGEGVDPILDALVDAAARGVDVQVLMDEAGDGTPGTLSFLSAHGVQTRLDSPTRTLHNKLLIADDVVLLGSHNLTPAAMNSNHEGSVRIRDPEIREWFTEWFDSVWDDPAHDPNLPPLERIDLIPLADRDITGALIGCIDNASARVDLVMYAIAWNDAYPGSDVDLVLDAIESASLRGVEIGVVLDGSSWSTTNRINDAAIQRLRQSDVELWTTGPGVTTHAKVLRCDSTLIISDANWSYSGLELMHGTSLLLQDPEMVSDTEAWMDTLRNLSTAL